MGDCFSRPPRVQVAQLLDLGRVGAVAVRTRRLHHGRQLLQRGMREERAEPLAELALEHVRVAVAVRAERRLRVVHVERAQPVEADAASRSASTSATASGSPTSMPET